MLTSKGTVAEVKKILGSDISDDESEYGEDALGNEDETQVDEILVNAMDEEPFDTDFENETTNKNDALADRNSNTLPRPADMALSSQESQIDEINPTTPQEAVLRSAPTVETQSSVCDS